MKKIEGWLNVSLEGFAQQNQARPKEHLIKELIQNSLDAIGQKENGLIEIEVKEEKMVVPRGVKISCKDNGQGVIDIENIRTMFWTSKKDSHLQRGRMGRGFKELLCLCSYAQVISFGQKATFHINTNKQKELLIEKTSDAKFQGTSITMVFDWDYQETLDRLWKHFQCFLLPPNVQMHFNSLSVLQRTPAHHIRQSLTTECFDGSKWVKPQCVGTIELYPLERGEKGGLIYEMGIPICPVEWDAPYHANILQRVPMNPNRDAVMSGFCAKIHRACLPTLITEMTETSSRSSWVGEAAYDSKNEALQKEVLRKAFGENLARSVPGFGKFDHDADAKETANVKVLDTKQLSGGFRNIARIHLPTSKDVAQQVQKDIILAAKENNCDSKVQEIREQYKSLLNKYGTHKVSHICKFHKFMADNILSIIFGDRAPKCTVKTAIMAEHAEATWSDQMSILTLALDLERIWNRPFDKENFSLIIHETAHELAAHHGNSFANALEECAGAACKILIDKQKEINNFISNI